MATFLVEMTFDETTAERRDAVRPRHREYLSDLADRGLVLASGPTADGSGAYLVFEAADEATVRELLAEDPYQDNNLVADTTVREWNVVLGAWLRS